jgi:hypothetical protein
LFHGRTDMYLSSCVTLNCLIIDENFLCQDMNRLEAGAFKFVRNRLFMTSMQLPRKRDVPSSAISKMSRSLPRQQHALIHLPNTACCFYDVQIDFEYPNIRRAKLDMQKASLGQGFMYTRGRISWVILKFDKSPTFLSNSFKRSEHFFRWRIYPYFKNGIIRLEAGAFKFLRNRLFMTSMQLPRHNELKF